MANNRLSMRKILEVLRLFFELGRSKREIARVIGASPTTVSDYLARTNLGTGTLGICTVRSSASCMRLCWNNEELMYYVVADRGQRRGDIPIAALASHFPLPPGSRLVSV
jgi:hypothetical protein